MAGAARNCFMQALTLWMAAAEYHSFYARPDLVDCKAPYVADLMQALIWWMAGAEYHLLYASPDLLNGKRRVPYASSDLVERRRRVPYAVLSSWMAGAEYRNQYASRMESALPGDDERLKRKYVLQKTCNRFHKYAEHMQ